MPGQPPAPGGSPDLDSPPPQEIYGFLVVFLIVLACFSFWATAMLGFKLRYFHNFSSSMISLIRLSVGVLDFDYNEWQEADDLWAPIFLVSFVVLVMMTSMYVFCSSLPAPLRASPPALPPSLSLPPAPPPLSVVNE